jgi:hypothetical protein
LKNITKPNNAGSASGGAWFLQRVMNCDYEIWKTSEAVQDTD